MPGNACSCSAVAELMSTGWAAFALAAEAFVAGDAFGDAGCERKREQQLNGSRGSAPS